MRTKVQWLNVVVPLCRSAVWGQDRRSAGGAERAERREGKIKADGTPWGRSAGQALVCTLLGVAPSNGGHGAAIRRNASLCKALGGTLAGNPTHRQDPRR